jgi:hypothetical protein
MKLAAMIGIAISEFWEMTPAELNIYAEVYAEKQKNDFKEKMSLEYYNALWTIQWLGKKSQHPKPLQEILNSIDKPKKKAMTDKQMLAQVKALNAMFGGEIIDKTKK